MSDNQPIPGYPGFTINHKGVIRRRGAIIHPVRGRVTLVNEHGRTVHMLMSELMDLLNSPMTAEEKHTMATTTVRVDDLTAQHGAETVRFGWNGTDYEIDLTPDHRDQLEQRLAPYLAAARPARRRTTLTGTADRETATRIRAWAKINGVDVADRGRLPRRVVEAYQTAHRRTRHRTFNTPTP